MDTKEKVRNFIIDKIASVINEITNFTSRSMDFNNIEHMKLKDSITSITDKHLDNLHKELEVLFKLAETETVTGDRIQMSSGLTGRRFIIDPRELESLSDAITKEQIDNPPPKKHKCSSGDRLDIVEARVRELDAILARLLLLVDSHETKVKEIEAETPRLKRFAHSHFASELSL